MQILIKSYKRLLGIIYKEAWALVFSTCISSIILGLFPPITLWVNQQIYDRGILVSKGSMKFKEYIPILLLLLLVNILPIIIKEIYINGYVKVKAQLIFRSVFKQELLQKAKRIKYENYENDQSLEIIEKAYNRVEIMAMTMFPGYLSIFLTSVISSVGFIFQIYKIKWWLLLTIIPLFVVQVVFVSEKNKNIYDELEKYWNEEKQYNILAEYLRSREYSMEIRLCELAPYLIGTYQERLNKRNKQYESYYLNHLKKNVMGYNIIDFAVVGNIIIFLILFLKNSITVGVFISLTSMMVGGIKSGIYRSFNDMFILFNTRGYHINFYDFLEKYFSLPEQYVKEENVKPENYDVEFRNVWFKYPGTSEYVLQGVNFKIAEGEKISLVGANGEGKSTIVKLMLGLFSPDKGEIFLGGESLAKCDRKDISSFFAPIFQDFICYSLSLRENIGIGYIDEISNDDMIFEAMRKAGVDSFGTKLPNGIDTLLNKEFKNGVDVSGGQWQRIAIARAFMGNKPFMILDEPTAQLDPMAESKLYEEFSKMIEGKSALFVTHRLASTKITNRILVLQNGVINEEGTHDDLMRQKGLYYEMFSLQRQWYQKKGEQ